MIVYLAITLGVFLEVQDKRGILAGLASALMWPVLLGVLIAERLHANDKSQSSK